MIWQNDFGAKGNTEHETRKIWRENMKSTVQLVCAVALIAALLSGCRTRARNNTATNMTTQPTTMPTTAMTTMPETQVTTQPTTNTTTATTATTNPNNAATGDDIIGENASRANPNARGGMTGQNGTGVAPGGATR